MDGSCAFRIILIQKIQVVEICSCWSKLTPGGRKYDFYNFKITLKEIAYRLFFKTFIIFCKSVLSHKRVPVASANSLAPGVNREFVITTPT